MISIIIATYNRKDHLSNSIESILSQTYKDFEIIIVDDGSTDGTEELVRKNFKDSRIRYIKLSENKGATFARNTGLGEVRGEYFMVWDSDDVLYPNALEVIINIFNRNHNLAVVSSPARSLLRGKEIGYNKVAEGVIPKDIIICRLLPSNHKIRVARTSLCGEVRYKARNVDFLVNVEMAQCGKWYSFPEYLGDVILESNQNSLTLNRRKTNLDLAILRAPYLADYLIKYADILKTNCPEKYAGFSYGAAIGFFANGNKEKTRYYVKEALKIHPKIRYILLYLLNFVPLGLFLFKGAVKIKNIIF